MGELTELRVEDLDFRTRILTVSRAVVEVNPKFHPEGGRFLVKHYPKDKEYRLFKLSSQIVRKLRAHVDAEHLGRGDLLFAIRERQEQRPGLRVAPSPDTLGLTEPNSSGRCYRHGTLMPTRRAGAVAGTARTPTPSTVRTAEPTAKTIRARPGQRTQTATYPADWFRNHVWKPALQQADLEIRVRIHDLRHAHASWLQMSGVASAASFGASRERPLSALQHAGPWRHAR